jgi:parallel beta-helix repeat protein
MKYLALFVFVSLAASAATVYRVDPTPVQTTAGNAPTGGFPAVFAVANATISLCSDQACTIPVASYTDITGSLQCATLSPVTTVGSPVCSATTNQQGGFGFWLASGTYYYTVTLPTPPGGTYGPYAITVPATGLPSSSLLSPLNFGGTCNGTTNDTTAVALAVSALGYLWIPPGLTCVTSTVSVTAPNFVVFGGGGLKLLAGTNGDLLHFDGSGNTALNGSHFRVDGMLLDGNFNGQTGGTGNVIFLRNASYSTVTNTYIHSARGAGVHIENYNASNYADEVNIGPNNFIFGNGTNGVEIVPASNSSTYQQPGDHIVIDNHINYNTGNGIYGQFLTSSQIQGNNILTNGAQGIYLTAADRVTISNNAARNNTGNGLFITQDATFGRSKDILVEGNNFHYNSFAGTGNSDEADIFYTDRLRVLGNYLGDTDFTARANYGLQLSNDTVVDIGHNICYNLVAGCLLSNGDTYSAYGNYGIADFQGLVWSAPSLLNGWSNVAAETPAGYTINSNGFVQLEGNIGGGTITPGTVLFTLPAGYRPVAPQFVPIVTYTISGTGYGALEILANGNVELVTSIGSATGVVLNSNFAVF